jgi:hypothetical protein
LTTGLPNFVLKNADHVFNSKQCLLASNHDGNSVRPCRRSEGHFASQLGQGTV